MAGIVERFAIELGLDPTPYTKGRKEVAEQQRKLKEDALKTGASIEEAGRKSAESMRRLARELLTLFAVFTGTRSLTGFVTEMTKANAELGRFSYNLNQSPQTVAAWGAAAERLGGSAQATAASFESVSKALYDLNRNGQLLPKEFSQLMGASGRNIRTDQGADVYFRDVAGALKEIAKVDPARAHFLARGLGIDDGTANVMIKYGDAVGRYIKSLERFSPDNAAIKASQKLQESWLTLQQTAIKLGSVILTQLQPYITEAADAMARWIEKNQDWLANEVSQKVQDFANYLAGIDWVAVGTGFQNFATGAKAAADAVGGLTNALQVLFGLWAGSKAANLLFGGAGSVAGGAGVTAAGRGAAVAGGGLATFAAGVLGVLGIGSMIQPAARQMEAVHGKPIDPRTWGVGKGFRDWLSGATDPAQQNVGAGGAVSEMLRGMDKFGGTKVDGKPVSKGNPMPVVVTQGSDGGGGGFWSGLWNSVKGAMGLAGAGPLGFGSMLAGSGGGGSGNTDVQATGPANNGKKGWWTKDRQQHAYDVLTKGGLSPSGAKGLISRWMNVEASGGPSSVNHIGAVGIAQWLADRRSGLMQFAKQQGTDWRDYDTQLKYVLHEVNSGRAGGGSEAALRGAGNDRAGAIAASRYERAEGYSSRTGIDNFTGRTLGGMAGMDYKQREPLGLKGSSRAMVGAGASAALSTIANTSHVTTSNTSNAMHVGKVEIHAPRATDASGIARKMRDALERTWSSGAVNYGMK